MRHYKHATLLTLALAVTACQNSDTSPPAAVENPAASPAPTAPVDPNLINTALVPEAIKVELSFEGMPRKSADGKSFELPVRIQNSGTADLYGKGDFPVRIGVQLVGESGNLKAPDAVRDFSRTALPLIKAGSAATVWARVPMDERIDGKFVRIDLVQEKVSWFEKLGTSPLLTGPFTLCGANVCGQNGQAIQ